MENYFNFKKYIKCLFFGVIQLISLILIISFGIIIFNSIFIDYEINQYLPIKEQEKRAIFLLSTSIFIVISIFIVYLNISQNIFDNIILNIFLSFISFLFIPYFIYKIIKEKKIKYYIKDSYRTPSSFKIIFWDKPENDKEKSIIIKNTIFTIFQFLISLTSILLIAFTKETEINDPTGSLMIGTFSYFTEWTNIASCFFMLLILITGYRFFFDNNSFTLAITSYISIVGIIFSLAFVPMIVLYHTPFNQSFNTVKSIWFHIINPTFFILYSAYVLWRTKLNINMNKSYIIYSAIFPLTFAIYVYSLPFFTNVSIYGFVTNMNSNIVPYYGNPNPNFYNGGWPSAFFLIGLSILFLIVVLLSRFLLKKNLKKWENQ